MGGKQSLTRNLFGAGKGDRERPCEISRDQERANYCLAFDQCFLCGRRKLAREESVKTFVDLITGSGQVETKVCTTCKENLEEN